jgi:hypothetical protein
MKADSSQREPDFGGMGGGICRSMPETVHTDMIRSRRRKVPALDIKEAINAEVLPTLRLATG